MTTPAPLALQWRPIDRGDACRCGQLTTIYINQFGGTRERCEPCERAKRIAAIIVPTAGKLESRADLHLTGTRQGKEGLAPSSALPPIEPGALRCQVCACQAERNAKGVWARFCVACLRVRRAAGPRSRLGTTVDMSTWKPAEYQPRTCRRCPTVFTPTREQKYLCDACKATEYVRKPKVKGPRFCACGASMPARRGRPKPGCDTCYPLTGREKKARRAMARAAA